jgi:hypothetical protein
MSILGEGFCSLTTVDKIISLMTSALIVPKEISLIVNVDGFVNNLKFLPMFS